MSSNLEEAKKNLNIKSVNLKLSSVRTRDEMESYEIDVDSLEPQSYRGIRGIKEAQLNESDSSWWEYYFLYAAGLRLVDTSGDSEVEDSVLVEIQATFSAAYRSQSKLDLDVLEAFAESNVGYHVWPYWREYVSSVSARLGIQSIEIPHYFCKSPKT